jgi:hypothetical protein
MSDFTIIVILVLVMLASVTIFISLSDESELTADPSEGPPHTSTVDTLEVGDDFDIAPDKATQPEHDAEQLDDDQEPPPSVRFSHDS